MNVIGEVAKLLDRAISGPPHDRREFLKRLAKKRGFVADLGSLHPLLDKLNKSDAAVVRYGHDMVLPELRKRQEAHDQAVEAGEDPPQL